MHARGAGRAFTLAATALVSAVTCTVGGASARGASAASPTVTIATGGRGDAVISGFTAFDPAVVGYQRSEVFLSGTDDVPEQYRKLVEQYYRALSKGGKQ